MADTISVGEAARLIGACPRDITNGYYSRWFADNAPIVGGRRMVPRQYLPTIKRILREHGRQVAAESK